MRAPSLASSLRLLAVCSFVSLAACGAPVEEGPDEPSEGTAAQALDGPTVTPAMVAQIRAAFLQASAASPAVRQAFAGEVDITFRQGIPMGCTAGRVAYALPVGKLLSHPAVYPAILAQGISQTNLDAVIHHPGVRPIRLTITGAAVTALKNIIVTSNPRGYNTLDVLQNYAVECNANAANMVQDAIASFYETTAESICYGEGDEFCADDVCSAISDTCGYMSSMPGNLVNECRDLATDCHSAYEEGSALWDATVDAANTVSAWADGAQEWAEDTLFPNADYDNDGYPNSQDADNRDPNVHITPQSEAGIPMIVDKWLDRGFVWLSSPADTCSPFRDYNNMVFLSSSRRLRLFMY